MTIFTPNIPQPNDDPSASQDQILQNFLTLNSAYGTAGDHYAWTNTNAPETRKHAKVTLPGLPTTSVPGNTIPAPTANDCAIFGQTRDSQTTPFVTRDGLVPAAPLTNIWPLMPVKAYATFQSVVAGGVQNIIPLDSFNINTSIVQTAGFPVTFDFTLTNACRTQNYGIFYSVDFTGLAIFVSAFVGYNITGVNTFTLTVPFNILAVRRISVMVVES